MAGGTFISQNKVRPGAYINFKAVPQMANTVSNRGIVTIPLDLSWGELDSIIEVKSTDLASGVTLKTIGLDVQSISQSSEILRQALQHAPTVLVYRLGSGGTKAMATLDNLVVSAKHVGKLGNDLTISIIKQATSVFEVVTILSGVEKDRQKVINITELVSNDWVEFASINETDITLKANAGVGLENGADPLVSDTSYSDYFAKVSMKMFNTMALPKVSANLAKSAKDVIYNLRENKGRKCQVVVINYPEADYEGVISIDQTYDDISIEAMTAYIAGLTASSSSNVSNTYHVIRSANKINGEKTDDELEQALLNGQLVLSYRQDGAVIIEQDINTLKTLGNDKNKSFIKNRVIRVLDDIANTIQAKFSQGYIGKINNNVEGRNQLKGDVIGYFNSLQDMGSITNFDSSTDIDIVSGSDVDSVVINVAVQPVDAMEKLYMTVNVN